MPIINGAAVNFVQNYSYTVPPLQGQHGGVSMHSIYGQPLLAPYTATTTVSSNSMPMGNEGYQHVNGQSAPSVYRLQGSPYQLPPQSYNTSSLMTPPSSVTVSLPQTSTQHVMRPLRPTMSPGYGIQNSMPDPENPTRVVGSQGRRGVLPSAPGRPPVAATGTGSTKNAAIPAKDGIFPCPHCTKTYLHAKHLKRHLLRHTGDHPYMCFLCRDTFSRCDVLKRHFQKCSLRRGNPSGASHLSARAPQLVRTRKE